MPSKASKKRSKLRRLPSLYGNPFLEGMKPNDQKRALRALEHNRLDAEQNSLLLALPAELRNQIFHKVLVEEEHINIDSDNRETFSKYFSANKVIEEPALLQTCRSIRTETISMYYSNNVFISRFAYKFFRWLQGLSSAKRAMLKNVRALRDPELPLLIMLPPDYEWFQSGFSKQGTELGEGMFRPYITNTKRTDAMWKGVMEVGVKAWDRVETSLIDSLSYRYA